MCVERSAITSCRLKSVCFWLFLKQIGHPSVHLPMACWQFLQRIDHGCWRFYHSDGLRVLTIINLQPLNILRQTQADFLPKLNKIDTFMTSNVILVFLHAFVLHDLGISNQ